MARPRLVPRVASSPSGLVSAPRPRRRATTHAGSYRYGRGDVSQPREGAEGGVGGGPRGGRPGGNARSPSPRTDWAGAGASQDPDDGYGGWSAEEARGATGGYDGYEDDLGYEGFGRAEGGEEAGDRDRGATASGRLELWPLRSDELHELFPLSGTPGQYSYYWGTWDQAVQRFALSLLITLVATNSNSIMAAGAFTYSAWGPVVQSMVRNLSVKKYPYGGFWEASVLGVGFRRDPPKRRWGRRGGRRQDSFRGGAPGPEPTTTEIRVGEPGKADVVLEVPYELSHELLREGDPALLIVVSNSPALSSFKAVREVFLPATRQWLGDYPFVSRRGFQQVRDRINYQRREEGAGGYRANF